MKKIVITLFLITFIMAKTAYSSVSFFIPVSLSRSFPNVSGSRDYMTSTSKPYIDYRDIKNNTFISTGFLMNIAHEFVFNKENITGVTLASEIGYYMKSYSEHFNIDTDNSPPFTPSSKNQFIKNKTSIFHTLNVGLIFKLNFLLPNSPLMSSTPFSFGIGGGVKIPFSMNEINDIYTDFQNDKTRKEVNNYSYTELKNMLKYLAIPYIKLTFDYNLFLSKKIAMLVGAYISYDFPIEFNVNNINAKQTLYPPLQLKKYSIQSLDIGIMIGLYIGKENNKLQ